MPLRGRWEAPTICALGKLRLESGKLEARLGHTGRPGLRKTSKTVRELEMGTLLLFLEGPGWRASPDLCRALSVAVRVGHRGWTWTTLLISETRAVLGMLTGH